MVPNQPVVQSVQLLQAPPAESLNFHMKLSDARSHDSKFDKIAVKVNQPQKVKSTKNQEVLNLGKNDFYRSNHNLTYFKIKYKLKRISKMSKSRNLVGNSPLVLTPFTLKLPFWPLFMTRYTFSPSIGISRPLFILSGRAVSYTEHEI